jgi:hypothetical protein
MSTLVSPVYPRIKRKSTKTVTEYCFTVKQDAMVETHKFIDEAEARSERERVANGGHRDLVAPAAAVNIIDQLDDLVAAAKEEL